MPRQVRDMAGVDIVTSLYDLADLPCLDRLMFSIMAQVDGGPLRLHLMLQRFSVTEVQSVREATRELRQLQDQVSVTLHNWDHPVPFDLRVPLLNWGLEVAPGRYVMCLDVHDQLYPHACTTLLTRLRDTTAAIALGGIVLRPAWWWGDVVLPMPDQDDAPACASCFMIDRHRLAIEDCVFRASEPNSAVEEFIERLGASYEVDARCQVSMIAIRQRPP